MTSTEGDQSEPAHPEGGKSLSANTNAELRPTGGEKSAPDLKGKSRRKRSVDSPDDVSRALRSAYDDALGEKIPDDFLDLLGKLS